MISPGLLFHPDRNGRTHSKRTCACRWLKNWWETLTKNSKQRGEIPNHTSLLHLERSKPKQSIPSTTTKRSQSLLTKYPKNRESLFKAHCSPAHLDSEFKKGSTQLYATQSTKSIRGWVAQQNPEKQKPFTAAAQVDPAEILHFLFTDVNDIRSDIFSHPLFDLSWPVISQELSIFLSMAFLHFLQSRFHGFLNSPVFRAESIMALPVYLVFRKIDQAVRQNAFL